MLTRQLLMVKKFSPWFDRFLRHVVVLELVFAALSMAGWHQWVALPSNLVGGLMPLITTAFAVLSWRRQQGASKLIVAAFAMVPLGHVPLIASLMGVISLRMEHFYLAQAVGLVYLLMLLPAIIAASREQSKARAAAELDARLSRRSLELQKQVHESQRDWISMMTHEIKTPLAVIDTSRQSLARIAPGPEVSERLERIHRSTQRIDALVHELLTQRDLEVRHQSLQRRSIHLRSWLSGLLETTAGEAAGRIELRVPSHLSLEADGALLDIALGNLLQNALRHSLPDTPITLSAHQHQEFVDICLESQGAPVPEELRPRMFQRYVSFGRSGGHGIGLWASRSIALAHGGDLELKVTDTGNQFCLQLPLHAPAPSSSP